MLRIFDSDKKNVELFDGYDSFLSFITSLENQKLLEGAPSVGKGYWGFAEYSPEKLKHVCAWIKPEYLTTVQTKALEQQLGLIEICRGDPAALQEVPLNPDLSVKEFKKSFCLDYCRQRGWRLIETRDHKRSSSAFTGEPHNVVLPFTRKSRLSQTNLDNARGRRLRAELDCRIGRLRQQPAAVNSAPNPAPAPTQKREF